MKTLKLNLIALAIVLGSGAAFATAGTYRVATIYFNCTSNSWQTIPPGRTVNCNADETKLCTGTGTPSNPVPLEDRIGCGTLAPL